MMGDHGKTAVDELKDWLPDCISSIKITNHIDEVCVPPPPGFGTSPPNDTNNVENEVLSTIIESIRIVSKQKSDDPDVLHGAQKYVINELFNRYQLGTDVNVEEELVWKIDEIPSVINTESEISTKVLLRMFGSIINIHQIHKIFSSLDPPMNVSIEWSSPSHAKNIGIFGIFPNQSEVRRLLRLCFIDKVGRYLFEYKLNECQIVLEVVPWICNDAHYALQSASNGNTLTLDERERRTVSLSWLSERISATFLAQTMSDIFGEVIEAEIRVDQHKYPTGDGVVAFQTKESYRLAINTQFIFIRRPLFNTKLRIDPLVLYNVCSLCGNHYGNHKNELPKSVNLNVLCRACLEYFCPACWFLRHTKKEDYLSKRAKHIPLMANQNIQKMKKSKSYENDTVGIFPLDDMYQNVND
ncbi:hypothetical protein ACOME3_004467 [Neoechinorhynchus agilis]